MPIQMRGVLVHAMSGTELSRVRTEFRLHLPELINKSSLESSGADIVMQSSEIASHPPRTEGWGSFVKLPRNYFGTTSWAK
jgi:hypothetical protein